ncbi:CPBP family intramembrane glutamic endopeptidase [Cellulomonas xiejunii]|uniref:CPBP family intramembrane metalloprotease n=1 Tax=Cellulomonas xiejunii TaxID=2968083 RepID=A0ABY5KRY1_9CELL|nr:CPBP family intramembrane glutamic endopeptidase [Cellulomonas xiejunii]MCC2314889.1 CPBP family intramembrane metalloprotease [Cellulomonas xiejunii]MCC2322150.1 CPBP family intramembrane metalloprotease [Cellulomonas xiejunii]MCC2323207.1 CPBP family intramembrane metalloprotease [Cellulomonas xiejunii]UUI72206.1 CPBP family intramembrane metalloprotease [Cellulomonas xiejunii]
MLDLVRRFPLLSFVVLAIAGSWIAWIPLVLGPYGLGTWDIQVPGGDGGWQLFVMLPGAFLGPIGAAFFVTAVTEGRSGVRAWVKRVTKWKVNWRWYVGILVGTPAAVLLSALVITGGDVQAPPMAALVAYLPYLVMQVLTTGLAEEPGWRDFALPRAQRRFGALPAAVGIGVLWGVWHLPLFATGWGHSDSFHVSRALGFILFCVLFNVVMTWVFNRTGQSLPMAMLLHVSINTFASVLIGDMFPAIGENFDMIQRTLLLMAGVGTIVTLLATRGKLGYQPEPAAEPTTRTVETAPPLEPARLP